MKQNVKNRLGKNILVLYQECGQDNAPLAILQHGYSGSMDEAHIEAFAQTYRHNGYNTLLLDCTNSFNDADGRVEDVTIETHYDDLCDAIEWAEKQDWFNGSFALFGHSLGGMSVLTYAQNFPEKLLSLVPAATVVTGDMIEDCFRKNMTDAYQSMRETGKMRLECSYKDDVEGYRYYEWFDQLRDWDALFALEKLTMPKFLLVGESDYVTPPKHQEYLFDRLPENKHFEIIRNADHAYRPSLNEACQKLDSWLKTIS